MITVERLDPASPTFEAEFRELGEFLVTMAGWSPMVPVDAAAAAKDLWVVANNGVGILVARLRMVEDEPGRIVGSLGLIRRDVWYNPAFTLLSDHHFYIAEDQRFALVGVKLLRAAKAIAQERNEAIVLSILNAARKPKDTTEGYYATIAGFAPLGVTKLMRAPKEPKATDG